MPTKVQDHCAQTTLIFNVVDNPYRVGVPHVWRVAAASGLLEAATFCYRRA